MKLGKKLIFLVKDPIGFGSALFEALRPIPPSTRVLSSLEIPLPVDKYGIEAVQTSVTVEIAQFLAPDGSIQISIFLLANLQPPMAVCAINELLLLLSSDSTSYPQTMILPYHVPPEKLKHNLTPPSDRQAAIFGFEVGSSTDSAAAILDGVPSPPSALRIEYEVLNCMMQLIQVYKIPGILLAGMGSLHTSAADEAHKVLQLLGSSLADRLGLMLANEISHLTCSEEQTTVTQEPWRALYG